MSAVVLASLCVDDLEVLDVIVRVGAEGELHTEALLHAHKKVGVLAAEALEHGRVHEHAERIRLPVLAGLKPADDRGEAASGPQEIGRAHV